MRLKIDAQLSDFKFDTNRETVCLSGFTIKDQQKRQLVPPIDNPLIDAYP
jgi:hypothetical protein